MITQQKGELNCFCKHTLMCTITLELFAQEKDVGNVLCVHGEGIGNDQCHSAFLILLSHLLPSYFCSSLKLSPLILFTLLQCPPQLSPATAEYHILTPFAYHKYLLVLFSPLCPIPKSLLPNYNLHPKPCECIWVSFSLHLHYRVFQSFPLVFPLCFGQLTLDRSGCLRLIQKMGEKET